MTYKRVRLAGWLSGAILAAAAIATYATLFAFPPVQIAIMVGIGILAGGAVGNHMAAFVFSFFSPYPEYVYFKNGDKSQTVPFFDAVFAKIYLAPIEKAAEKKVTFKGNPYEVLNNKEPGVIMTPVATPSPDNLSPASSLINVDLRPK